MLDRRSDFPSQSKYRTREEWEGRLDGERWQVQQREEEVGEGEELH